VQVVRFAGVEGSDEWPFTVDLPVNASLSVRACAAISELDPVGHQLAAAFSSHMSLSYVTTWCLNRTLSGSGPLGGATVQSATT
jgi:hypothetical protein